ncbi:MAG: methyltransferase domain-containing protein [Thermoanaerobacterales bacterium]|nr:methyltransferase domain-containing protein [Thermoanaerobacterales bacterium]
MDNFKCACVNLYEHDLARMLLGESFHPGGLGLTRELGELLGLTGGRTVLDVACGNGATALYLARAFGCRVIGVDLGAENIARARRKAAAEGLDGRVEFVRGDAEKLPVPGGSCDAVISECAFCTFPDKPAAAAEMYRALRPGGVLGISDMTVDQDRLPGDMKGLLFRAACIADALPVPAYLEILGAAGFSGFTVLDRHDALHALLASIRARFLLLELGKAFKKLDLDIDLEQTKALLNRGRQLVDDGVVGYVLLTAFKGRGRNNG